MKKSLVILVVGIVVGASLSYWAPPAKAEEPNSPVCFVIKSATPGVLKKDAEKRIAELMAMGKSNLIYVDPALCGY